ncbi:MAG: hypothetical protein ACREB2_04075 [Pseudolabrys sp.]
MISIVNGYVCTTSCEAAAARAGKDPHAPPGTPPGQSNQKSGIDGQPATVFCGALKSPVNPAAVAKSTAPSDSAQPLLNILA